MVDAIPVSYDALHSDFDRIIERQIFTVSRGRCPIDERQEIKQEVYVRAIGKQFLETTRLLYQQRGGGCFERSLYCLTRSVTCNHFEHNQSRPLQQAMRHPIAADLSDAFNADALLDDLRQTASAVAEADFSRQLAARDTLDKFYLWLQGRRGTYARTRTTMVGARVETIELAEVYRLWILHGESRVVTREIALDLHVSEAWVRQLKLRIKKAFVVYQGSLL